MPCGLGCLLCYDVMCKERESSQGISYLENINDTKESVQMRANFYKLGGPIKFQSNLGSELVNVRASYTPSLLLYNTPLATVV
jgi:hypothetical protein